MNGNYIFPQTTHYLNSLQYSLAMAVAASMATAATTTRQWQQISNAKHAHVYQMWAKYMAGKQTCMVCFHIQFCHGGQSTEERRRDNGIMCVVCDVCVCVDVRACSISRHTTRLQYIRT